MGFPSGLGSHLRHAHAADFALVHEALELAKGLLERDAGVLARRAEDVNLLGAAEHADAVVDAGSHAGAVVGRVQRFRVGTALNKEGNLGSIRGILLEIAAQQAETSGGIARAVEVGCRPEGCPIGDGGLHRGKGLLVRSLVCPPGHPHKAESNGTGRKGFCGGHPSRLGG